MNLNPFEVPSQETGNIGYLLDYTDSELLLTLHNNLRAEHEDTPDLVWNNTLVSEAYKYMKFLEMVLPDVAPCSGNLRHSESYWGANTGENLAAATGDDNVETLFNLWATEGDYYNYNSPSTTGGDNNEYELGHFTQIVWKDTSSVGCGVQVCQESGYDWTYLICRYYTEGNIISATDTWALYEQNVLPLI